MLRRLLGSWGVLFTLLPYILLLSKLTWNFSSGENFTPAQGTFFVTEHSESLGSSVLRGVPHSLLRHLSVPARLLSLSAVVLRVSPRPAALVSFENWLEMTILGQTTPNY